MSKSVSALRFDNEQVRRLPRLAGDALAAHAARVAVASRSGDRNSEALQRARDTPNVVFSAVEQMAGLSRPRLAAYSPAALRLIGLRTSTSASTTSSSSADDNSSRRLRGPPPAVDLHHISERELAQLFSGNVVPEGAEPSAHCYCGHQFGHFSGQLGDGRAVSLGEIVVDHQHDAGSGASALIATERESRGGGGLWSDEPLLSADFGSWEEIDAPQAHRPALAQRWELQLKGAGQTTYSRGSDGRAVLRSSIREFLCSEYVHHLGIPTTRAGTLTVTTPSSDAVDDRTTALRDMFYDGNAKNETCAIVLRIARCFVRLGSFQIAAERDDVTGRPGPSAGNPAPVIALMEYVCERHYPQIFAQVPADAPDRLHRLALLLFAEVASRTARLVAMWQSVGFCHGVLNSDNLSVLGATIDYGPFGFMEYFDKDYVCNHSDNSGRYSYDKQPQMCRFDVVEFGKAIFGAAGTLGDVDLDELTETHFEEEYHAAELALFRWKLGALTPVELEWASERLQSSSSSIPIPLAEVAKRPWESSASFAFNPDAFDSFEACLSALMGTLQRTAADFTNVFRALSELDPASSSPSKGLVARLADNGAPVDLFQKMRRPQIPRGRLQQLAEAGRTIGSDALERAVGVPLEWVMAQLRAHEAFDEKYGSLSSDDKRELDGEAWEEWLVQYLAMLKTWSADSNNPRFNDVRQSVMQRVSNPAIVLRNWMCQDVLETIEKGDATISHNPDFSKLREMLDVVTHPFDDARPSSQSAAASGACDTTSFDMPGHRHLAVS